MGTAMEAGNLAQPANHQFLIRRNQSDEHVGDNWEGL